MGAQQSSQLIDIVNNVTNKTISIENSAISNTLQYSNQTLQNINFVCDGCTMNCVDGFSAKNITGGKIVIVGNFTEESAKNIKSELNAEITSAITQKFAKELGVLGGAFNFSQDEMNTKVKTEVSNLIENTINTTTLNDVLASVVTVQNNNLTFKNGATLTGKNCVLRNENIADAQLSATSQKVSETLIDGLLKTKIAQDIQQDYKFKAAGLEAFVSAIIFIVIALILLGGGFAWKGSSLVTNPQNLKLLLIASTVFVGIVLSYYFVVKK